MNHKVSRFIRQCNCPFSFSLSLLEKIKYYRTKGYTLWFLLPTIRSFSPHKKRERTIILSYKRIYFVIPPSHIQIFFLLRKKNRKNNNIIVQNDTLCDSSFPQSDIFPSQKERESTITLCTKITLCDSSFPQSDLFPS